MTSWIHFNARINLRHPSLVRSAGQVFVTAEHDNFPRTVAFACAGWVSFLMVLCS